MLGVVLAEDLSGFLLAEILKSQCPGTVFKLFILHARTLKFQKFCQDLVAEAVGVHKRTAHTANGEKSTLHKAMHACMATLAPPRFLSPFTHTLRHFRDHIHGSKKQSNRVVENNAHGQSY